MRNAIPCVVLIISVCTADIRAQSMSADNGPGGMGIQVSPSKTHPPAQTVRFEDILPSSVHITFGSAQFILWQDDNRRYGPFVFKEGVNILLGNTAFALTNINDKVFSLKRIEDGQVSGPFEYREKAEVKLGNELFKMRITPSYIRGHLQASDMVLLRVPVALISLNGRTAQNVTRLYSDFKALIKEIEAATAPLEIVAPRVHGMFNRDNIINRSTADVTRAEDSADLKARKAFEKFLREAGAKTSMCPNPGDFAFQNLQPGRYLVCIIAAMKDSDPGKTLNSKSVIWWADVLLGESQTAALSFSTDNATTWQSLFPKP